MLIRGVVNRPGVANQESINKWLGINYIAENILNTHNLHTFHRTVASVGIQIIRDHNTKTEQTLYLCETTPTLGQVQ